MDTRQAFINITAAMNAAIIGQETVVERLLIAFLADGHVLMEGLPGVAKTRSIKTLGKLVESEFSRVQFTPDLLPSDVTGSEIYREQTGSFEFQPGPIFGNLVLADEINRAPAKVHGALRSDGGAAGNRRRYNPQTARAFSGSRHPEPN